MNPAEEWLRTRLPGAPAELTEHMIRALPATQLPLPEAFAEGALALLEGLSTRCGGREYAWPLLAADALLTHALEAQAEIDPEGVAAMAERLGPAGRIGELAERMGAQEQ